MDQNDFDGLMKTCREQNLIYLKDLLRYYNNLDAQPMLQACLKQKELYYSFELDMYKDGFSLPGLSENIMFLFALEGFKNYFKQEPHCIYIIFSCDKILWVLINN